MLLKLSVCSLLLTLVTAGETPWNDVAHVDAAVAEAPALSSLASSDFTTLWHPELPRYGVRIKKSHFCDGSVNAYTGYIDVEARHLFFYFFESRRDPSADDVVFWTNGGPGGASSLGLFTELGPCILENSTATKYNPYSWNEYANVFFIEQPVGVGFSYADHGESVDTTEEAAKDIAAFVAIFFNHFTEYKGRALHLAGESYGGRYLPLFAAEIYDQNTKIEALGMDPVNLSSIMIGNGCTDQSTMIPSYYDMECTGVTVDPVLDIGTCVSIKRALPRCNKWLESECFTRLDGINCRAALSFCEEVVMSPFMEAGFSPFDMTKRCSGELCLDEKDSLEAYLNLPAVRQVLGIDPSFGNYSSVSMAVNSAFEAKLDHIFPTQLYLTALLERGVRVLLYVGANDWVCNWVGNERMSLAMEWTGQSQFVGQPLAEWTVDGRAAGLTRSAKGLTFATVYGAGHMVPTDKPKESLQLVYRWLSRQGL